MKYPIDVEKYIAAMQQEFGPNAAAEDAHRAIIPLVNDAYDDGFHGRSGYPLDLEAELSAFAEHQGTPMEIVRANRLLPLMFNWINSAYAQGRQEAEDTAAYWAKVLAAVRNGKLAKDLALDRIDCIIFREKDADIRRFLKKMRRRIRWMKTATT